MYICKNCGEKYITDEAVICVHCHAPRGMGQNFCPFCGKQLPPGAGVCMNCGVDIEQYGQPVGKKSKVAAGLLGIFLGCYGAHNFYLGYKRKAFTQLGITAGSIIIYFISIFALAIPGNMEGWVIGAMMLFILAILGMEIWGLVEGIMILCGKIKKDGKGMLLKD